MDDDRGEMLSDTLSTINIDQLTSSAMGAFNQHVQHIDHAPSISDVNPAVENTVTIKVPSQGVPSSVSLSTVPLMLSVSRLNTSNYQGTLPPILPLIHQSGLHPVRQLISPVYPVVSSNTVSLLQPKTSIHNALNSSKSDSENLPSKIEINAQSLLDRQTLSDTTPGISNTITLENTSTSLPTLSEIGLANVQKLTSALLCSANGNIQSILSQTESDPVTGNLVDSTIASTSSDVQTVLSNVTHSNSLYTAEPITNNSLLLQQLLNGTFENQHILGLPLSTQGHSDKNTLLSTNVGSVDISLSSNRVGEVTKKTGDNENMYEESENEEDNENGIHSQHDDEAGGMPRLSDELGAAPGLGETTLMPLSETPLHGIEETPSDGVVFNGGLDLLSLQTQLLGSYLQTNTDLGDLTCNAGGMLDVMGGTVIPQVPIQSTESQVDTDTANSFPHYCAACNLTLHQPCDIHGTKAYHVVDTPNIILSKARMSLPKCLYLKPTSTSRARSVPDGVYAYKTIPCNTKFGPMIGKVLDPAEKKTKRFSFPEWKMKDKNQFSSIVMEDEEECNWMMFVRIARTVEKINVRAHQIGMHVYFFVTRDIQEDEELNVWFSQHYSKITKLPLSPVTAKICECLTCATLFKSRTQLNAHSYEVHGIMNLDRMTSERSEREANSHLTQDEISVICGSRSVLSKEAIGDKDGSKETQCGGDSGTDALNGHSVICGSGGDTSTEALSGNSVMCGSGVDLSTKTLSGHPVICGYRVELSKETLNVHKCGHCKKIFKDLSNFKKHQRIHMNERNYKCAVCHKGFRQKIHLQVHMATHNSERQFKCQYCTKTFYRKYDCQTHEKWHNPEKGMRCQYCYKLFYKTQNFKRHLLIHTGQKDFECQKCEKRFYTKQHLKRHEGNCKGERPYLYNLDEKVDLQQVNNASDTIPA